MPVYTTAANVAALLAFNQSDGFTTTTVPTTAQVDNMIDEADDTIDAVTNHAWRSVTITNEWHDLAFVGTNLIYHRTRDPGIEIHLNHRMVTTFNGASGDKLQIWDGCLTGDTLVMTPEGYKPIYDAKGKIFTFDIPKCKMIEVNGEPLMTGIKDIFRLSTREKIIKATENHPFLVVEECNRTRKYFEVYDGKRRLVWRRLKDLKEGDIIMTTKDITYGRPYKIDYEYKRTSRHANNIRKVTIPSETDDNLMRLLGYYIGDGSRAKTTIYLHIFNPKKEAKYIELIKKIFGVEAKLSKDKKVEVGNTVYVTSIQIKQLFESLGVFGTALTKRVPDWIYNLPKSQIRAFIEGYVDADGCRTKDKNNECSLVSINRKLMEDVKKLCNIVNARTGRITKTIRDGNSYGKNPLYRMTIHFEKDIVRKSKGASLDPRFKIDGYKVEDYIDSGFNFEKIILIEHLGQEPVYDIVTNNPNHNFIANQIIVHNSTYVDWIATKTEGRADDFHVDYEEGIIWLKSASTVYTNRPVRVTYRFGETTITKDIQDLATKMVAIKILTSSRFVAEGLSSSQVAEQTRMWRDDIENLTHRRTEFQVID